MMYQRKKKNYYKKIEGWIINLQRERELYVKKQKEEDEIDGEKRELYVN